MKTDLKSSLENTDFFITGARRAVKKMSQTLDDLKELDLSSLSEEEKETLERLLRLASNAAIAISDINNLLSDQVKEIQEKEGKK